MTLSPALFGSSATSWLVSSMFTKTSPASSLTARSGLPFSLIVPATVPFAASITVASWLLPLKVNTRLLAGS